MALLTQRDARLAERLVQLAFGNPFLPERVEREREVLGEDFSDRGDVWSHHADGFDDSPNFHALMVLTETLVEKMQVKLRARVDTTADELRVYEDLASFLMYYEFRDELKRMMSGDRASRQRFLKGFWARYRRRFAELLEIDGYTFSSHLQPAHLFALGYQLRRAFEHTFYFIIGQSLAAARLRAAVWESVFTHDMRRYNRGFFQKMGDYVTLIMGPSGTGKELVARAIGSSRYIEFDEQQLAFADNDRRSYFAVNLSALSPTLIESELFGHVQGSFTGATSDRIGWLESCPAHGTVFLDEIGELDMQIQVKLLRVFQERTFQRLGDITDRNFSGKIIAATNRDLAAEIGRGGFRRDFYYRICSDVIRTPTLASQIREEPNDLRNLVRFVVGREAVDDLDETTDQVLASIIDQVGIDYPWPGNIRELEQCVRNILIRQHYEPLNLTEATPTVESPLTRLRKATDDVTLSVDELLRRYCTMAYAKYGSYESAAEKLSLDRRTLRKRVDISLLDEL